MKDEILHCQQNHASRRLSPSNRPPLAPVDAHEEEAIGGIRMTVHKRTKPSAPQPLQPSAIPALQVLSPHSPGQRVKTVLR